MLEYIDEICRKNKINYYLLGGTLIGAIRHKGFIPWDDDVDICILINDYKKLIKILEKDFKYNIHNPYDNEDYYYFFTKMTDKRTVLIENNFRKIDNMGVFLDIFPIYNMPNSEEDIIKFANKIKKLERIYFRFYGFEKYYYDKNKIRSMVKAIAYFPQYIMKKNIKNIRYKILNLMEEYENIETDYIGNVTPPCNYKNVSRKEVYKEKVEVEFEELKVWAPIGYDEHLRKIFGDYMQPPPEDQRVTNHNFKAYWK